jgi:hypothetical protein
MIVKEWNNFALNPDATIYEKLLLLFIKNKFHSCERVNLP